MPDIDLIESDILAGLPRRERERIDRARENLEFARGCFERFRSRPVTGIYQSARYERTSLLFKQVVAALTRHLYGKGPARSIPDADELTDWLSAEYARLHVDATMQDADRYATIGDACAIQVLGTGDPEKPVRLYTWPAHQFLVWEDDVDPTKAAVVATIDYVDEQRHLRLWTAETVKYYATDRNTPGATSGGTAFRLVDEEENTYKCVPFAFVHFNRPSVEFWAGGPGDHLREANDYVNYFLTELGDSIRYCAKPILKGLGIREGWTPPNTVQPGDILTPPPAYLDEAGNGINPSLDYLQPDLGYVESAWSDLQSFLDHTFECNDVPAAAFRMVQSSAMSGAAIVQEQMPLVLRAQARQRDFLAYERDLARAVIAVAAAELRRMGRPLAFLDPGQADGLTARWPSLVPDVPSYGAAQDAADLVALQTGQTSRVAIAMRKHNFTRDQAIAYLKQIAADLIEESAIGLPSIAAPVPQKPQESEIEDDG